jgi:hypothetical protein
VCSEPIPVLKNGARDLTKATNRAAIKVADAVLGSSYRFGNKTAAKKFLKLGQYIGNRVDSVAANALKHYFLIFKLGPGLRLESDMTQTVYNYIRAERQDALKPAQPQERAAAADDSTREEAFLNLRLCRCAVAPTSLHLASPYFIMVLKYPPFFIGGKHPTQTEGYYNTIQYKLGD